MAKGRGILALLASPLTGWLSRLRFPWLLGLTLALFVADLAIPDVIPFVDELLLGLIAAVLAGLRKKRRAVTETGRETRSDSSNA